VRLVVALVWQVSLFQFALSLVLDRGWELALLAVVWVASGLYLLRDIRKSEREELRAGQDRG